MRDLLNQDEKLAELEAKFEDIKSRLEELESGLEKLKNERDELNKSARDEKFKALKYRENRDRANSQIAEFREKSKTIRSMIEEKELEIKRLEEELKEKRIGVPSRKRLTGDLKRIEWEFMTTPTSEMLQREKELIEKAKMIREKLSFHDEIEEHENRRMILLAEVKALRLELKKNMDEREGLHKTSAQNHERMVESFKEALELSRKADEIHKIFKERLEVKNSLLKEAKLLREQIRDLKTLLKERRKKVREAQEAANAEKKRQILEETKKKLEAGKKLSFEEMKLIFEDKDI
ncbi:hypothetical protein KEJ21_07550 [Candidatus Bathyarchaeota archaeon]|nr:hypothetical protein [Candidatus Bathyarchaeota archaeon]MBS7631533.1 hypothetical protein [Candidatus Bathyarchaeota archaeon]